MHPGIQIGFFSVTDREARRVIRVVRNILLNSQFASLVPSRHNSRELILLNDDDLFSSGIWAYPHSPAGIRGRSFHEIDFDEAGQLGEEFVTQSCMPTLRPHMAIAQVFASTPYGAQGIFFRLWTEENDATFNKYRVRDEIEVDASGRITAFKSAVPWMNVGEYEQRAKSMGALAFRQEMQAEFIAIGASLFAHQHIMAARDIEGFICPVISPSNEILFRATDRGYAAEHGVSGIDTEGNPSAFSDSGAGPQGPIGDPGFKKYGRISGSLGLPEDLRRGALHVHRFSDNVVLAGDLGRSEDPSVFMIVSRRYVRDGKPVGDGSGDVRYCIHWCESWLGRDYQFLQERVHFLIRSFLPHLLIFDSNGIGETWLSQLNANLKRRCSSQRIPIPKVYRSVVKGGKHLRLGFVPNADIDKQEIVTMTETALANGEICWPHHQGEDRPGHVLREFKQLEYELMNFEYQISEVVSARGSRPIRYGTQSAHDDRVDTLCMGILGSKASIRRRARWSGVMTDVSGRKWFVNPHGHTVSGEPSTPKHRGFGVGTRKTW
jgi:hypothetical protein